METEKKVSSELTGVNSECLLDRQEMVYREIEDCKTSYELRYVMAYEAAIRNSAVYDALFSCILDKDCAKLKQDFGFSDEAILYFHITHKDLFPVSAKDKGGNGLSSISEMEYEYRRQPYKITSLCSKEDSIVINDVPLVRDSNGVSIATIENYAEFKAVSLEANFKRPKLLPVKRKNFYVNLNFDLPESEMIEYVAWLYKVYHKEEIKSTMELLSDFLEFSDSHQIKANSRKFADMLYVYDYALMYGDAFETDIALHEKIANDIRYSDKRDDKAIPTTNTIRNYQIKMNYLVEERGYKEFLTGIEQ